jgi:LuxR family maltose regulon positive regulatory protein
LNEGLHRRLTLISAPAGFGKTTLVSEWVAGCERPAAWLSLDEADSDPATFPAYLIAALQTIAPNVGEGLLRGLQSPQPAPIESILTALLNEITTVPDDSSVVLDDYHVFDAQPIDKALTFLLEHLPRRMHLVITTREDPDLPLARYRGQGRPACDHLPAGRAPGCDASEGREALRSEKVIPAFAPRDTVIN